MEEVESVEIYYLAETTLLKGEPIEKTQMFDLISGKVLKDK